MGSAPDSREFDVIIREASNKFLAGVEAKLVSALCLAAAILLALAPRASAEIPRDPTPVAPAATKEISSRLTPSLASRCGTFTRARHCGRIW